MTLTLNFKQTGFFETADLMDPEPLEKNPIQVKAFRFVGTSKEVALILGGVHSQTEPEGVKLAREVLDSLMLSAATQGKKPGFTTVVIPQLFDPKRLGDGGRRIPTWVPTFRKGVVSGEKPIWQDTNRNFPQPGESYAYVSNRANAVKGKNPQLKFPPELTCGCLGAFLGRIAAENRILIQLIEQLRPIRTASIHQHSRQPQSPRGNEPGIFVDPRGGFDEYDDRAYTREGEQDDKLAHSMLQEALSNSALLTRFRVAKPTLLHPFRGNITTTQGREDPAHPTVHYSSDAVHDQGTSLGGWAPWAERFHETGPWAAQRPAMPIVTVEMPYDSGPLLEPLKDMLHNILQAKFLEP